MSWAPTQLWLQLFRAAVLFLWLHAYGPASSIMSEDEESIAPPAYGAALAATLELREKTFPKKTSWAYAPLKTKPDDCRTLAQLTVDGPAQHANGSSYDSAVQLSTCDGPLAQQFITLNTQLAR